MLVKFISLYLLAQYSGAEVFDGIYQSQVRSRATACLQVKGGRSCEGVIWQHKWLLVRGSCIAAHPAAPIYVKKGTVNCTHDITTPSTVEYGEQCVRHVMERFRHRMYPHVDLAMLQLDWPYSSSEMLNYTANNNLVEKLDLWTKIIRFNPQQHTEQAAMDPDRYLQMYSTPIRMFLFSVVLPSFAFMIFFIYVIFFTGSNKTTIPYKHLHDKKKSCV